jgi:hypothetical protein
VTYGDPVRITAGLDGYPGSVREVGLWRSEIGFGHALVKWGRFDERGDFSATFTPRAYTTFTVAWRGDERYRHESRTTVVRVRPRIRGFLEGGRPEGTGRVYSGRRQVVYQAYFVPIRLHDPVAFEVDKRVSGKWKRLFDDVPCHVDAEGGCRYPIGQSLPSGLAYGSYRVRGTFEVQGVLARGTSSWSHFRITR